MNNSKVRIYDLSKELNLENKDILVVCDQLDIAVKSHSSTISEEDAQRIRTAAKKHSGSSNGQVSSPKAPLPPQPGKRPKMAPIKKSPPKPQQILAVRSRQNETDEENGTSLGQPQETDTPRSAPPAKPSRPLPPSRPQATAGEGAPKSALKMPPQRSSTSETPAVPPLQPPSISASNASGSNASASSISAPSISAPSISAPSVLTADEAKSVLIEESSPEAQKNGQSSPSSETIALPPSEERKTAPVPESSVLSPDATAAPPTPVAPPERPLAQKPKPTQGQPTAQSVAQTAAQTAVPKAIVPPRRPQPSDSSSASPKEGVKEAPQKPAMPKAIAKDAKDAKEKEVRSPGVASPVKDKPTIVKNKPTIAKERLSPTRENKPVKGQGNNRPSPGRSDGDEWKAPSDRKPAAPQVMELRRPRPVRPPDPLPSSKDADSLLVPDEAAVDLIDVPVEELEKPRLRRPMEASKVARKKSRIEEEEDEKEAARKASKLAPKGKRRTYILDEDEDDLDDLEAQQNAASAAAMTISLARPAKPKNAQTAVKPGPTPAAAKRRSSGGSSRENRQRRDRQVVETRQRPEIISLDSNMSLQDLADMLVIPETEIIKTLFMKGIVSSITQTLDMATIQMIAEENGVLVEHTVQESKAKKTMQVLDLGDMENLHRRPPVVTVMGHVDHGKTSLLDSIRKTRVAQGEAGGITQHIGAYHVDVEHNGKMQQVVFLDTPGHEAFTAMRARGAKVTDLAILVVAADDGVRPQTIEAISHAKAAQVPLIVAINKIDKEDAQPERVKQELTEYGLIAEDWGGDTIMVPVSAIKGENLDTLLEMILLVSEVEELSANPDRLAKGSVIEAHLDKSRGPVATLLVQNGTLRVGDILVTGSVFGKVRAMINDRGKRVDSAGPSIPVEVLGLSDVPAAGDEFEVFSDEKEARSVASDRADTQRLSRLQQAMASRRVSLNSLSAKAQEGELKELNLILKADVQGSVEAILGALEQITQKEVQLRVLLAAPGEVTETDVDLAAASGAVILGFNTTLASGSKRAADESGVDVREYEIIYKLLEDVQGAMEGLLEPELVEEHLGQVEVRAIFPVGRSSVAGCYIQSGKATRNCHIRVHRGKEIVHTGTLNSLRRMKEDVKEVNSGYECGIGADHFNDWQEGDIIETFRLVTKRRTLTL